MEPMGLISTQLISFKDINVDDTDLVEDAWGLNSEFSDVIAMLSQLDTVPQNDPAAGLLDKIRKSV
jgi:hypothetical protein